jgi:hypothetical protein
MTQILKRIDEVNEKIKDNFDIFSLPLISKFCLFQFSGRADNSLLTPNYNLVDLQGRTLVIKSIKIVPYYENASQDFYLTDGVTVNQELIPADTRINRIFDQYSYGCQLSLFLNGSPLQMFPSEVPIVPPAGDGNVPIDLDLDNIFYKYPAKLVSFDMRLDARIYQVLNAPMVMPPLVKVFIGCYLI